MLGNGKWKCATASGCRELILKLVNVRCRQQHNERDRIFVSTIARGTESVSLLTFLS